MGCKKKMRKRFDDLFSALMFAAGVAVVLAGTWCLSHSIDRTRAEMEPVQTAEGHLEAETPRPLPTPSPVPEPEPAYRPDIPLSPELQQALHEACEEADVPVALALGVIQVESGFRTDAVSSRGCYGLMQLNPKYFPDKLSPEDNIREGVAYLGRLLEEHGDTAAALTAYAVGYDAGGRTYAGAVLEAAEGWTAEK